MTVRGLSTLLVLLTLVAASGCAGGGSVREPNNTEQLNFARKFALSLVDGKKASTAALVDFSQLPRLYFDDTFAYYHRWRTFRIRRSAVRNREVSLWYSASRPGRSGSREGETGRLVIDVAVEDGSDRVTAYHFYDVVATTHIPA